MDRSGQKERYPLVQRNQLTNPGGIGLQRCSAMNVLLSACAAVR
jgi:hypothetical protein